MPGHLAVLLDLVLPRQCLGCGRAGVALCGGCGGEGPVLRPAVLQGRPVVAAAVYADALRTALLAYKERGRRDLATPLAALLTRSARDLVAEVVPRGAAGRVVLVAVPSSAAALRLRGADHLAPLLRRAAVGSGLRVAPSVLHAVRDVRDSAGLGVAARAANLDRALRARPAPRGTAAVLVDDIVTTGATLREAARALTAAGWPVLGAAVVAATPLPSTGASSPTPRQGTGHGTSVSTT